MNKRFLFLNGSPHQNGHSMALARQLAARVPGESRFLHLYDMAIAPCRGCDACRDGTGCILRDDCDAVVAEMADADAIFLVSPLHFTSLTAPLVALISRFQQFWNGVRVLGGRPDKRGGILVTAGGEYPKMFDAARRVGGAALVSLNIPVAGMVTASGTDSRSDFSQDTLNALDDLAAAITARPDGSFDNE